MQIIGIDVAKATFDIALPLGQGKFRTRGKLSNARAGWQQLLAWRDKHAPGAAVGMEATGIYHEALARSLVEAMSARSWPMPGSTRPSASPENSRARSASRGSAMPPCAPSSTCPHWWPCATTRCWPRSPDAWPNVANRPSSSCAH